MDLLPDEILCNIIKYSRYNLSCVNKHFNDVMYMSLTLDEIKNKKY